VRASSTRRSLRGGNARTTEPISRGADLNTYGTACQRHWKLIRRIEQQPLETSAWDPAPDAAARGLKQDASSGQPPKTGNWQIANTLNRVAIAGSSPETHVEQALQSIGAFLTAADNPQNRHSYRLKLARARSGTCRPSKGIARISV